MKVITTIITNVPYCKLHEFMFSKMKVGDFTLTSASKGLLKVVAAA